MKQWRKVPGYENYEISIEGRECLCRNTHTGKVLSNHQGKNGYIQWHLHKDGKNISRQAARWIAMTFPEFVENEYFEGAEIDHKDTNRLNNHPTNLKWVTSQGNKRNPLTNKHLREALGSGGNFHWYGKHHTEESKRKIGESNKNNPHFSKPVGQYTKDGELIKVYPSAHQAARETGFAQANISATCSGKYRHKTTGGYIWKYLTN